MSKSKFTLMLPEEEARAFGEKAGRLHVTRTSILRSFIRQWVRLKDADFVVQPVRQGPAPQDEKGGEAE